METETENEKFILKLTGYNGMCFGFLHPEFKSGLLRAILGATETTEEGVLSPEKIAKEAEIAVQRFLMSTSLIPMRDFSVDDSFGYYIRNMIEIYYILMGSSWAAKFSDILANELNQDLISQVNSKPSCRQDSN